VDEYRAISSANDIRTTPDDSKPDAFGLREKTTNQLRISC